MRPPSASARPGPCYVNLRLLVADFEAIADTLHDTESGGCECDDPPYKPEPGESGQVECPACVARRLRAAFERGQTGCS